MGFVEVVNTASTSDRKEGIRRFVLVVLGLAALAAPLLTARMTRCASNSRRPCARLLYPIRLAPTTWTGDLLARLFYGARLSLLLGFFAGGLGLAVGLPLGAISGYCGGWIDLLVQRFADLLLSFPSFLLALSLAAMLGGGLQKAELAGSQNEASHAAAQDTPRSILQRGNPANVRWRPYIEATPPRMKGASDGSQRDEAPGL